MATEDPMQGVLATESAKAQDAEATQEAVAADGVLAKA